MKIPNTPERTGAAEKCDRIRPPIDWLESVFGLPKIKSAQRLMGGVVNKTWKAQTDEGAFVIQANAADWFPHDTRNFSVISEVFRGSRYKVPTPRVSASREEICPQIEDAFWRVFDFVENDPLPPKMTPELAFEMGDALGVFHREMTAARPAGDFAKTPFHGVNFHLQSLQKNITQTNCDDREIITLAAKLAEIVDANQLPAECDTLIHGDPKRNNFLVRDMRVTTTIDVGGAHWDSRYFDLGDAVRNWCNNQNNFDGSIMTAGIEGYLQGCQNQFGVDRATVTRAARWVTARLAIRILNDPFLSSPNFCDEFETESHLDRTKKCLEYITQIE